MELNSHEICRTCLGTDGDLFPFLDCVLIQQNTQTTSVADFLKLFTRITASNRSLPTKICCTCLEEIKRIYAFRIKCEKSERTFRKLMNNKQFSSSLSKPVIIIDDLNLVNTHLDSIDVTNQKTGNPQPQHESICVKEEIIMIEDSMNQEYYPTNVKKELSPPSMTCSPSNSMLAEEDYRMDLISSEQIQGAAVNTIPTKPLFNKEFIEQMENNAHTTNNGYLLLLQDDMKYPESPASSYDPDIRSNTGPINDIMEDEPKKSNCVKEIFEVKTIGDDKLTLRDEMRKKGKRLQCSICMKSFKSPHTFLSHQQFGHVTYSCKYCSMKLKNKNKFRKHILQHEVLSCVFGN